jgi:hypothetical protein
MDRWKRWRPLPAQPLRVDGLGALPVRLKEGVGGGGGWTGRSCFQNSRVPDLRLDDLCTERASEVESGGRVDPVASEVDVHDADVCGRWSGQ